MNRAYTAVLGAAAFVGSFLVTFWLTGPTILPAVKPAALTLGAAVFAAYTIPDESIVPAAAKASGLEPSEKVLGHVDAVTRLSHQDVKIVGWAADALGEGDPIFVLVFFNEGKSVLQIGTRGARPDVASALKLSQAAALNLAFEGTLSCTPSQQLVVVAVTQTDVYAPVGHAPGPLLCPR